MAIMDELHIFLWEKTEKLKSVIIHIVQSHYPPSGNVHVILLKFKWPPQIDFLNICEVKKSNLIYGLGMIEDLLAPAVTVGETEGAMDSTSVFFGLFFCL